MISNYDYSLHKSKGVEWERCSAVLHICKFFIFVLFTLAFIALVKLCNDVASPFLYFLFSHLCFLTVKSQRETLGFFFSFLERGASFFLFASFLHHLQDNISFHKCGEWYKSVT